MELELNKWYDVHDDIQSDLELVLEEVQSKDSRVGVLMKYEVGIIEFERSPYLRGNMDGGRGYYIDKFMLIKY
ncbi:hypothetical protein UFOVP54_103 [uncultured Caudovirales phage]|uniref:Uncharacterized protein n=1 Tax=uncultured Caudovirales phage TaxID=2100421 RepID=A0A6J5KVR3_9CAUD|nr:hypothetical protein UFOVP54_103 [uncultured Caudovirales phage]